MTKKLLHITTDPETPVTTTETTDTSSGSSFAGRVPELDANGHFDPSLYRDGSITPFKFINDSGFINPESEPWMFYVSRDDPATGWMGVSTTQGDITLTDNAGYLEIGVRNDTGIHRTLSRLTSDNTVGNSTSEGTLFTYTVPADTMGSNRSLRLTLGGTMLVNSGITNVTLRVKLGSQTLYQDLAGISNSATTRAWRIVLEVSNRTASTQRMSGEVFIGPAAAATTGTGDLVATSTSFHPIVGANGTVDTTASQAIAVTAQWNNANASITMTAQYGILELV